MENTKKVARGARNCLYPLPVVLVGANVGGKPNYLPIAHIGIMDFSTVSVSIGRKYYTNAGIKENSTFSVNIPSTELVKKVDYCGLVSGKTAEKADLFTTFYGILQTAPMIVECPITMECRLLQQVGFPNYAVYVGEIAETYYDDQHITNDTVDLSKVQPILFNLNDKGYWTLGERFATAWDVGSGL
jgi:flavin reductase (DIM6/NTAB) family NADH-FMN oxidoreductase RutF